MTPNRNFQTVLVVLLSGALLAFSGCVDDSPLRITGTMAVTKDNCDGKLGTIESLGGSLDIAPASREQSIYLLQLRLDNDITPPQQSNQNTQLVTTEGAGNINLKEVIVSYTSKPSFSLKKESIPVGGVLGVGGKDQAMLLNVMGRNAADTLVAAMGAGDETDLTLSIQVHGVEQAGGDVYSTTVTYPIHVTNSGTTCAAPDSFGGSGICGAVGGQDGTRVCCASDPTCVAVAP